MDATEWYREELRSRASREEAGARPQLNNYKYTTAGLVPRSQGVREKEEEPLSAFPATLRAQFQCLGADDLQRIEQRAQYTHGESEEEAAMARRVQAAMAPLRRAAARDEARQQRHTARHVQAAEVQERKRLEARFRTLCRW